MQSAPPRLREEPRRTSGGAPDTEVDAGTAPPAWLWPWSGPNLKGHKRKEMKRRTRAIGCMENSRTAYVQWGK